jgi:hypothetical protein
MVILLMVINNYCICGYWWLFYEWLLITIVFVAIGGYSMNGY